MGDDQWYDSSYSKIQRIDFDILGNDEIKRMSALGDGPGIEIPELYDNSEPRKGGINDPRLGSCSKDTNCPTCGLETTYCVGHFGHINLAEMVFHIGYLPFLQKILSCICLRCGKLLVHKNEDELKEALKAKTGKERMSYIKALSKNVTYCQNPNGGCGAQIPKIKGDNKKKSAGTINIIAETELDSKIEGESKKKLKQILTPEIIYHILKNISDDDCRIIGLDPDRSRPEDMIHKIFPVPPIQMRPSAKGDFGSGSSEDDLTHKLADIVKANLRIIKNKEGNNEMNTVIQTDHANLLQLHVALYIDNDSMALKSDIKSKPFKDLSSRLKGKTGRVRGNLMGKRGDFTARTVITSDPTIAIYELGTPVKIAMNLTFPDVVTPYNIEKLTQLIKNGRDVYPGANNVFLTSRATLGKRVLPIDLRYRKESIELHYGDIVERHLIDGDIVLLNRQPTLHKQSMMGHRIKVINNPHFMTFRMNVAVTTPYNADFDGDEMNIFLPQTLQTQIELEELACVEKQLITPTTSSTVFGIVQDGLLGSYNLTDPTVRIDWRTAMNIMSYTTLEDFSTIKKNKDYTGSELYSLIIPPNINLINSSLTIKNGQLLEGRLSKSILGAKKKNNLVQLIWDAYGVNETQKFIDNTQRLINNFNLWHGFSVGSGDLEIPKAVFDDIDKLFETTEIKVDHIITEMENNPDIMTENLYELKLFSESNIVRENVSKLIMDNYDKKNGFNIMALSGSKGDETNTAQMIGCLGMQAFEGKLIPKKYNFRTSAYFHQHDDRTTSRGLIRRSFTKGLEFPDYVFHTMVARIGTIDQAIKTSITGYAQRKLVKLMEDNMIAYDNTVRNSNGKLLQIIYGDSGADTTKQYEYTIKFIEMNNEDLRNKHKFTSQELKN
jgi:DNA-directed RNA polymerase II subunit RPB1